MGSSAAEVSQLLQAARLHLAKGELQEAVAQATEAIRGDTKQTVAYLVRAEALRRLKRIEPALADLAVAIRLDPNQPGPYVIRAEILKRRNMFDQAIADATHALTVDPRNAAAFSVRAECRSAIGDMEGATGDLQEMLLIDPTRSVPDLSAKSSSGDTSPEWDSDGDRFRKQSATRNRDHDPSIFADGKRVDKSYRSRRVVSDEDAPEALGVASGYKPEMISRPIPRIRGQARQSLGTGGAVLGIGVAIVAGFCLWIVVQGALRPQSNPKPTIPQPLQVGRAEVVAEALSSASPPGAERPRPSEYAIASSEPVDGSATEKKVMEVEVALASDSSTTTSMVPFIEGLRRLEGHTAVVWGLAFSPDGKWLASGSDDSTVRLWSVASGQIESACIVLGISAFPSKIAFNKVAFSPDQKLLAASRWDGRIFLWDVTVTPPKQRQTLSKHDDPVIAMAFSPDGKFLATGGKDKGLVCIWDVSDPKVPLVTSMTPEKNGVWSLAYSPDGKTLMEGVTFPGKKMPGQIWAWDLSKRPYVRRSIIHEVQKRAISMVYSPNGSRLAYADGPVVRILDARTNKQTTVFHEDTEWVGGVAFMPSGRYLLSGGWDKTVRLWDATTGHQVLAYADIAEPIEPVAISLDGRLAAIGGHEKLIRLFQLRPTNDQRNLKPVSMTKEVLNDGGDAPKRDKPIPSRATVYRSIELSIDKDGSGSIVTGTRRRDQIDRNKGDEPGMAVPGVYGLKNAEITRLKDGRFRVIHDFKKFSEIDDLKILSNGIDELHGHIDKEEGVLVLAPVPQQGFKLITLTYPRQLRLPLQFKLLIADFIEDGIIGVNLRWPNSVANFNLNGTTFDKDYPRQIEGAWRLDVNKPEEVNSLFRITERKPLQSPFQIPLVGIQAEDRIIPSIGIRTSDQSKRMLKIGRIEVLAHVVGKVGIEFDERSGKIVVSKLLEGAGARAGLRPGDQVVSLNGKPVGRMAALMSSLAKFDPGDSATLNILRAGKPIPIQVIFD
jgi:WD40 repeat protein